MLLSNGTHNFHCTSKEHRGHMAIECAPYLAHPVQEGFTSFVGANVLT
jgi:hypothetical protein